MNLPNKLDTKQFLEPDAVTFDVRSPSEFMQGHIPGAINLPLFSDKERALVGSTYKQCGSQQATELGLKIAGAKLYDFVKEAQHYSQNKATRVHCWRGGMRSQAMAALLSFAGMPSPTLQGGYKSFRSWSLQTVAKKQPLRVLGGLTGSGKTAILHALKELGEQVLDLEGLANHRGSAFGSLGKQPTNEQFENEVAYKLAELNPKRTIWVEDESHLIGGCCIPRPLFLQITESPMVHIEIPKEERIQQLQKEYAENDLQQAIASVERIKKRLGGQRSQDAIKLIKEKKLLEAGIILLDYYDKGYRFSLNKRPNQNITYLSEPNLSPFDWAKKILS